VTGFRKLQLSEAFLFTFYRTTKPVNDDLLTCERTAAADGYHISQTS